MKSVFFALALTLGLTSFAQEEVILTVNDQKILKSEFEAIFKKNHQNEAVTKESLDEYAELFVNFKLKVAEAIAQGKDTIPTFIEELEGYRKQLARPYLTDAKITDELVQETFRRSRTERLASHILLRVASNATPADTLKAYNKLKKVKEEIEAGADFRKKAIQYSEEPSVAQTGGSLGYFTAMQMVYAFETAAYATPVGELSDIVRTRFGYHLIKVFDEREARGQVKVRHILISNSRAKKEKFSGQDKIREIEDSLKAGASFERLVKQFSDDRSTTDKGGVLPWFGTGKMVGPFEDAAFKLKKGAISDPFQTTYGWHIVEKIDEKALPTFEELKPRIENKISKDAARSSLAVQGFLERLKTEYNFSFNEKALKPFLKVMDTTVFKGKYSHPKLAKKKKVIFSFADVKYTQADLNADLLDMNEQRTSGDIEFWLKGFIKGMVNRKLMAYENTQLARKYPDFAALYQEYHDGILLFDLTNQEVWNKAVEDTTGLKNFFEQNRSTFMWKERAVADIFRLKDVAMANQAKSYLKKGWDLDKIRTSLNKTSQLNCQIESARFEKGAKEIFTNFDWKEGVSEVKELDGLAVFVRINEILPPAQKDLSEAKGVAIAKYQEALEKEWVKNLRAKYNFTINKDVLYTVQ